MNIVCAQCGTDFESASWRNRKFCCHACYGKYRKAKRMLPPSRKGVFHTEGHKRRLSAILKQSVRRGSDSPYWKGDGVGYIRLHEWVYEQMGQPSHCEKCGTTEGNFEWANKSREYRRVLSDWIRLCKPCHFRYDDVGQKMWKTRRTKANAA